MYPRNAAAPLRIGVGAVVLIADGTVQTSGVSIAVRPEGGAESAGGGTTAYGASGTVYYTPTQAETNYTGFVVTAYKAACIPASVTVITSASSVAGEAIADVTKINGGATAAANLKTAGDNYSATRGFTGTALPAVVADAAGGVPISDAGGLDLDGLATQAKLLAYTQLLARKDFGIGTDRATELAEINADEGSGAGGYMQTTDSGEAVRDQGDLAWLTGGGGAATKSYTQTAVVRTTGDDDGGVASDTHKVDGNYFSTGETNVGDLLNVLWTTVLDAGEVGVTISAWAQYSGGGSHAINVFAYNETDLTLEPIGSITIGASIQLHTFLLTPQHTQGDGTIDIRFIHSAGSGITSHVFHIDKVLANASTNDIATLAAIAEVPADVWDRVLTAATHDIATSAGRRVREMSGHVIFAGTCQAGSGSNTIILDTGASSADGAYDPALVAIIGGTGMGQSRLLMEYDGATRTGYVDRNWKETPDDTSDFVLYAHPGREHVNEGRARGGGPSTITLNPLASSEDDAYVSQLVFIRSGTGEDQVGIVATSDGTTKVATVRDPWGVVPDTTSVYVMLPAAAHTPTMVREEMDANSTQLAAILAASSDADLLVDTTTTVTSQTVHVLAAASADDDAYPVNSLVIFTDQATPTQKCVGTVAGYVGATRTLTLSADPGVFTITTGDHIAVVAALTTELATPALNQITLEVTAASSPLPSMIMEIWDTGGTNRYKAGTTDINGQWVTGGLLAADYLVRGFLVGFDFTSQEITIPEGGGVIELTATQVSTPPAPGDPSQCTLSGYLTDVGGTAEAGIKVQVYLTESDSVFSGGRAVGVKIAETTTNSSGYFEMTVLQNVQVAVECSHVKFLKVVELTSGAVDWKDL